MIQRRTLVVAAALAGTMPFPVTAQKSIKVRWDSYAPEVLDTDSLAMKWNHEFLVAVRVIAPPPTVTSRNLAILHTAMYNAWAAYDARALDTQLGSSLRRPASERTKANRERAISYAAYLAAVSAVAREFLTHLDNALYVALLLFTLGLVTLEGWRYQDLLWFVLGGLFFLPQEWLTHVHVLHWICPARESVYLWMYRLHYGHHDLPNRHDLMFMPLWLTAPMTLANYGFFALVLPDQRAAHAAFCGALLGYLVFEWTHLLCHAPVQLGGLCLRIRGRHLAHHFVDEQRCYAVSPLAQPIDLLTGHRAHGEGDPGSAPRNTRSPLCRVIVPGLDPSWTARARQRFVHRSNGDLHRSRLWLPVSERRHG